MRGLVRRPSPAMVVALIALVLAMGGTATALRGSNSVFKDDIAARAVGKSETRTGAVGKSEAGRDSVGLSELREEGDPNGGLTGDYIREDTLGLTDPTAYAMVEANGTIPADRSRNITNANITHPSPGVYCFENLGFTVRGGLVAADNGFGDDSETSVRIATPTGSALGFCGPAAVARVITKDLNTANPGDHRFNVWFTK